MNKIIIAAFLVLASCADKEVRDIVLDNPDTDTDTYCTVSNGTITCPDGTKLTEQEDEILLTQVKVPANSCTKIADGLWVESIQNSIIFDVYLNDKCADKGGEYCDNVKPSYGSTGQFGENKRGNGGVCTFESSFLFGERVGNDLIIKLLEVL